MTLDRSEATGAGAALIGHAALAAALYYLVDRTPEEEPLPPPPPSMQVSFVDEVGLTSSAPTTQPSAASSAAELGPPEEAAPAEADPVPEPTHEPAATPAARPAPTQRPTQQRSGASASTPARQQTRPVQQSGGGRRQANRGSDISSVTDGLGNDRTTPNRSASGTTISAETRTTIRGVIAQALRRCERQPLTTPPEAKAIQVQVNVVLNRDGSLDGLTTRVINDNPALRQYEPEIERAALRVVRSCTPISVLPRQYAQYYEVPRGWRTFPYIFDPRSTSR